MMNKNIFKKLISTTPALCLTLCACILSCTLTFDAHGAISPGMTIPGASETTVKIINEKTSSISSNLDEKEIYFNKNWKYAEYSAINTGAAKMYRAKTNRKNIVIGVNAGHGTQGGTSVKTFCHPDGSPKVTGGTTAEGQTKAVAVSGGMTFNDGTAESKVTLKQAQILKDLLLESGYDVLMIRDGDDVQLDNVARTVMCNQFANCHIALHWDSDGLAYDKGCFFLSVPAGIKNMQPVATVWEQDNKLGSCLIAGLKDRGLKVFGEGSMDMDLTQTSYSSVPSVDIELGNQCSTHTDSDLYERAYGILSGINKFYEK